MTQSHRMGWPAALNCIPLETRKAHVTPPRETNYTRSGFEALDYAKWHAGPTEAECRQVKQSINGAAQPKTPGAPDESESMDVAAPPSKSSNWTRIDLSNVESRLPAAPPSTTDKPQGVWVFTRDRKPPTTGAYAVRFGRAEYSGDAASYWDGEKWHMNPDPSSVVRQCQTWEWFDTTHSKQEDDGWVEWTPPAGVDYPTPPNGAYEVRFRNGHVARASTICTWGSTGIAAHQYQVIAYRTRSATQTPAANTSRPATSGDAIASCAPAGGMLTKQLEQVSSPAAPPSTTDKPQGVFKVGDRVRVVKFGGGKVKPGELGAVTAIDCDGGGSMSLDNCPGVVWLFNTEWIELLDTTPSKQEDDGWLEWNPKNGETPPNEGTFIDLRVATSDGIRENKRQLVPPSHRLWSWRGSMHRIIAYRIVKDQA